MKVLLKLFSKANEAGKWNTETAREKLFQLLAHAESKSIIIWHAGKNLPLEDGFEEYLTDRLTINWGGYGSSVSLEKTYDYFKYQYADDNVIDGKLKSEVTNTKKIFKEVEATFDEDVSSELIEMFEAQLGKISKKKTDKPILHVNKKGKQLVSHEPDKFPFFTISEDIFRSLFPEIKERKSVGQKQKKKKLIENYSAEEKEESIGSDRTKFSALKKLLSSGDKDKIDSGLMLLSSLNDPYVSDLLLEGISITKSEISVLEVSGAFKGSSKVQPYHNYAITGILFHAPQNATYCNELKSSLTALSIDIIDLSYIHAFQKLEILELSDSCGQITSLEKLSYTLPLHSFRIKNCSELSDISRIADFPLSNFTFSDCPKITSIKSLAGKTDRTDVKVLSFENMKELLSLDGIEFYQQLEEVDLSGCRALTNAKALLNCPSLKKVKSYRLENCTSIEGLVGSEETHLQTNIKIWTEPVTGSEKIESIDLQCSGMTDLEWLRLFPNTQNLEIDCEELKVLDGLKYVPRLQKLTISKATMDTLQALEGLHSLEKLILSDCHKIKNLDSLLNLKSLDYVYIYDCELLEDFSGYFSNKSRKFDEKYDFRSLPKLNRLGDISHVTDLREMEFRNSFNQSILADISTAPNLSIVKIHQDEVRIGSTPRIGMVMHIEGAKMIEIKNTNIEKLRLENCDIKDLSGLRSMIGLKYLSISNCSSIEALLSENVFSEVETLELIKLPKLKSLNNLDRFPKLKRIKLYDLYSISDISLLPALPDLIEVDSMNCSNFDVEAKPKGQMTMPQTMKFIVKIAENYKLASLKDWKNKLEEKSSVASALPTKTIQKIKKLLQSRELEEIKLGLSMVVEANNETLFDELLQSIVYEGSSFKTNKLFTGSGPAQPFLNTALMGVLSAASVHNDKWKTLCDEVIDLKTEIVSMDYLNCFPRLRSLELSAVLNFTIDLNLPDLENIKLGGWGWNSESIIGKVRLSQIGSCKKIKVINISRSMEVDDLSGLSDLSQLEELSLKQIHGLKINNLKDLAPLRNLKKLHLSRGYGYPVNHHNIISSLDGIEELKYLESLQLEATETNNTAALKSLSTLQKIEIKDNHALVEFTPPENAGNLETIILTECPNLEKIQIAKFAPTLGVYFEHSGFVSFPVLPGVLNIRRLDITYCEKLRDLDGLKGVISFGEDNYIKLDGCKKLNNLNGISHVEGTKVSVSTSTLPDINVPNGIRYLKAKELTSLKNIDLYSSIEDLDISSSSVKDLTPLSDCKNLKFLNIGYNKLLKNLKGLEKLSTLEILSLIDLENLEDISAIENLKLKSLYIYGCNKKKADFPAHLHPIIQWQTNTISR